MRYSVFYLIVPSFLSYLDARSFFNAIKVLLDWQPESSIQYILRMRLFSEELDSDNPMRFLGRLWLVGKFGNAKDIDKLIRTKTHK
jgi:hypothetical protein